MVSVNGLIKPNIKILLGIAWLVIAMIYMADRLLSGLDIRLLDWICWIAMFTAGTTSIMEGLRIKKNSHK